MAALALQYEGLDGLPFVCIINHSDEQGRGIGARAAYRGTRPKPGTFAFVVTKHIAAEGV